MTPSNLSVSIKSIMHRHVATVDLNTPAQECARRIAQEHIGCLIVVSKGKPQGIITERTFVDLVKKGPCNPQAIRATAIMSSPLITINPEADFSAAMEIFNTQGIKRLPVIKNDRIVGLLSLKDMIEFSNLALVNLEEKHRKLKTKADLDPLTGVFNKAATTELLKKEYERIQRYGGRSSVAFLDLDHFKQINDTYTHLAGDEILKQLGALLKKVCRNIDVIGRFGGEEFVIIAPNRKKYHAVIFGQRVREAIERHEFTYQTTKIRMTVSIGIASLFEGRGYDYAIERADKAMYFAKKMGRNRVGLWRDGKLAIADAPEEGQQRKKLIKKPEVLGFSFLARFTQEKIVAEME